MSTNNIGFYEDLTKLSLNYHQISSNTHLISSAESSSNQGLQNMSLVMSNPALYMCKNKGADQLHCNCADDQRP